MALLVNTTLMKPSLASSFEKFILSNASETDHVPFYDESINRVSGADL